MKRISVLIFLLATFSTKVFALESIWYYTETPEARTSVFANIKKINILAPQVYELGLNGTASSSMKQDILDLARENQVKVMPLLANTDGKIFNQKTVLDLLDNQNNWKNISDYMVQEAKKDNFYGWQLDLENIPISQRDNFNNFVAYLKKDFEKYNLILSAAIVAKTSDDRKDYDKVGLKNYWDNWAGAYDYRTLASTTDFLSVMAYDQPHTLGPVATLDWSKKVLTYSLANIPANKISFGIPGYGVLYQSSNRKRLGIVSFAFTKNRKQLTGAGISKKYGNIPWLSYNKFGKNYTIWYEDRNSFDTKLNLAKSFGVRGFSVWVLGDEDSKIWDEF